MQYAVRFVSANGNYSLPVRFGSLEAARHCAKRPSPSDVRYEIANDDVCIEFDSYAS